MDTRTEARSAGLRRRTRVIALAGAATLATLLTACQTAAQADRATITGPDPRPVVAAPQGIDRSQSADRIVEAIERREAAIAARFDGVPADRIEETLAREACADRLITAGYAAAPAQAASLCVTGAPHPNAAD